MTKRGKILLVLVSLAVVLVIAGVTSTVTHAATETLVLTRAWCGNTSVLPPTLNDLNIGTEISEIYKANLLSSNDVWDDCSHTWEEAAYDFHRFEFKIEDTSTCCTQLNVLHEGCGHFTSDSEANGHFLCIWNYANPGWEFVDGTTNGNCDQTLTGTFTTNWSNYIQGGYVYLLAITQDKGWSCPFLYTWNGTTYQLIGDMYGGAGLGYNPTPGRDKDYINVDGSKLIPVNGTYRLEIAVDQNEITYLDEVRLIAVDHSPDIEIYSPAPPAFWINEIPPFEIDTIKDPVAPVSATDGDGRDILPAISEIDRECTEAHLFSFDTITLDFGNLSEAEQIKLLYSAWMDLGGEPEWTVRREFVASHPGEPLIGNSYAEVINEDGEWERISDFRTLSMSKPRTWVVDITNWFKTDDYRVRLNIFTKTHFDYIAVDTSQDEEVSVTELAPISADLYWKGVSIQTSPDGKEPVMASYYDTTEDLTGFGVFEGKFTRYGDVLPLLTQVDDRFVIMHAGDSISINFNELPIPEGMERDYYVVCDGYYKTDAVRKWLGQDVSSVEPLPFHAMSAYPYPESESYPYNAKNMAYLDEYNTREFRASLSGESGHHTIYSDYAEVEFTPCVVGGDVLSINKVAVLAPLVGFLVFLILVVGGFLGLRRLKAR